MYNVIAVTLILTSLCIIVMAAVGVFCYFLGSGRIFTRSLAPPKSYGSAHIGESSPVTSQGRMTSAGPTVRSSVSSSLPEESSYGAECIRMGGEQNDTYKSDSQKYRPMQQQQHQQQPIQQQYHQNQLSQQEQPGVRQEQQHQQQEYYEMDSCRSTEAESYSLTNGPAVNGSRSVHKAEINGPSVSGNGVEGGVNDYEAGAGIGATGTCNRRPSNSSYCESDPAITGLGLQRAMSCDSVTSEASVDLDLADEGRKNGQLEFIVAYTGTQPEVVVNVLGARDLEVDPITGTIDSCVRVWLSSRSDIKHQTKIVKGTNCPRYDETFVFPLPRNSSRPAAAVDDTLVQFQLYSCDKYARYRLLGEAEFRLGDIELTHPVRLTLNLHDMDERPVDYGDVLFSMSYLPTAERLTLVISKARNLRWPVNKHIGDCCVKAYLMHNGKKVNKKKTSNKREDRNPIFNESMCFSLPQESLHSVQVKISVIVFLPDGGGAYPIGHVITGPNSTGTELAHWSETMTSLRKPITMWHRLRK